MWQIFLTAPKKKIRPRFDVSAKDEVHQADLLFLPHDTAKAEKVTSCHSCKQHTLSYSSTLLSTCIIQIFQSYNPEKLREVTAKARMVEL